MVETGCSGGALYNARGRHIFARVGRQVVGMDPMFTPPEPSRRVPAWRLITIMGLSLVALLMLAF